MSQQLEKKSYLELLSALGVVFTVTQPVDGGWSDLELTAEDLVRYGNNPDEFMGALLGVTAKEYAAWLDADRNVQCSAITKRGAQCRNTVPGGDKVSVEKWLELQGELCYQHRA